MKSLKLLIIVLIVVISSFKNSAQVPINPALKQPNLQLLKTLPVVTGQTSDTSSTFTTMSAGKRTYSAGRAFVSVDGGPAELVMQSDYIDTLVGNNIEHFATIITRPFTQNFINIVSQKFGDSSHEPSTYSMNTVLTNNNNSVIEERNYTYARTRQLIIPAFDVSKTHDYVYFTIKVIATDVKSTYNSGKKMPGVNTSSLQKSVFSSNFLLLLSGIPSKGISSISSITVTNNIANGTGTSGITISDFTIEVANSQIAPWSNWFQSANRATNLKDGEILLKGADLKTTISTISLSQAEIISFAPVSGSSPAKTRIGLRVRGISVKVN